MNIEDAAKKEMNRMIEVFAELKVLKRERAQEFYDFANNYFRDGKHFFEKGKPIEAFEAFIIAWAYLDIGLKLGLFETKLKKYFTMDSD